MSETSVKISIDVLSAAAEKALNQLKTLAGQVTAVFGGTLAAGLAMKGLGKIYDGIKDVFGDLVNSAAESEKSINSLNVALRGAGLYSAESSEDLQKFAEHIQSISIYSDDAVLSSAALLASLTNLDVAGIKKATSAATELAATLHIDLQSATELVAKAINGNTTALQKQGIHVEHAIDTTGRLANLLKAIAPLQGHAAGETNTYAGAMAQLANAQDDFFKNVGKLITQNPALIGAIKLATSTLTSMAEWVSNNKEFLNDLAITVGIVAGIVAAGAATMAVATVGLSTALGLLSGAAAIAWTAITGPVGLVVAAIALVGVAVYELVKHWASVKAFALDAGAAMLDVAAFVSNVFSTKVSASIKDQAAAWRDQAKAIRETAQVAKDSAAEADQQAAQREAKLKAEQEQIARLNAFKTAEAKKNSDELKLIEAERVQGLEQLESEHQVTMLQIHGQFYLSDLQALLKQQAEQLAAHQDFERQQLEIQIAAQLAKAKSEEDAVAREKAVREANQKAAVERTKLNEKQQLDTRKQSLKSEEQIEAERVSNRRDTFATIATLQNSNNQTLASIGKAAGITQIAIDTPVAVAKALAAFPPPFNFVAAGLVGAAMAAQAAQIAGIQFADGGIVPGTSYFGDNIPARVNSGELILNRQQQGQLFAIANGQSPGSGIDYDQLAVAVARAVQGQPIVVSINGKEIFGVIRDGLRSGRTFA